MEGVMQGMLAGALTGIGGATISGVRGGMLSGKTFGQVGMQFLKTAPSNIINNFGQGFTNGATFKALDGLTHWLKTYGDTGEASFKDFKEGVSESTFGDVNAIKSVLTTGGTAQDWLAVAMLLTPAGGKGKNVLQNNITDTPNNKKTPTETDTPNNKKPDENASVKKKITTFEAENQNKKGEAYENNSSQLLSKEGDVDSFGKLKDEGMPFDNVTGHHMPSNEFMKRKLGNNYTTRDGVAMNMEHPFPGKGGRHRKTATYDNNMTKAEQELYWNLSPREALAYDIKDVIKVYKEQGIYNDKIRDGLLEVIKQNKIKYPNLFKK